MSDTPATPDLASTRTALLDLSRKPAGADLQMEIAKILKVIGRMERRGQTGFAADLETILGALTADPPNLVLARELRYAIKMETGAFRNARSAWFMRVTGGSATAIVVLGLIASAVVWIVLGQVLIQAFRAFENQSLTYFPLNELSTIVIAALLGAVVSIMIRLRDLAEPEEFSPGLLFLGAFFKPFIGVIVAVFAYAALKSGIISSSFVTAADTPETRNGVYWVVSFVCGFSERFAVGLVNRVESNLGGNGRPDKEDGK